MSFSVRFDGVDALNAVAADLSRAAGTVGQKAAAHVRKTAAAVEATAKRFVPVDSGDLKRSIDTAIVGDGRHAQMSADVFTDSPYGGYVEWGTSRMAPHAYLGPALDRHSGHFTAGLRDLSDPLP